ncbi:hypothetical protein CC86DRAFT_354104 [Ophiobolus disseminans]|uniref:F-box domain-containing protein n=1 Tax=Ophiobolus disseminans TaxID=1469910 RepID=A0A6A6ZT34_9PLEO|nr:hypothetical protein CC86DRAFT_354104 [Ophiobolus disseminans]
MVDCYLYTLPNELLIHLFVPMTTLELLPLTSISRRLSTIILRILHTRLVAAAELNSHSLLLECYHPSAKLVEPPYFCAYHGTDGLSLYDTEAEDEPNLGFRLGKMRNMYSRFRPHQRELENGGRRVRPGDIPGSRTFPGTVQDRYQGETVKQMLSLESHELFTQLVSQTNLVRIGPRHGLFTCFVEVEEGVLRVWKDWLESMAIRGRKADIDAPQEVVGRGKEVAKEVEDKEVDLDDARILWVSASKNTGIRFNVKERKFRRDVPILIRADEGMPASYEIEYDELLIRTSHLLLMLEKSLVQEDNSSGKAVVFGSFG